MMILIRTCLLISLTPSLRLEAADFTRQYHLGDAAKFTIVGFSETSMGESVVVDRSWTQAEARLEVVERGSDLGDQVIWKNFFSADLQTLSPLEDLSYQAREVAPYWFSMSPSGSLALPPLAGMSGDMVGNVVDLHTFFMSQSKAFGIHKLAAVGDSFQVLGNRSQWDDGQQYFDTAGCQDVTNALVELTNGIGTVRTIYAAPPVERPCLTFVMPARMSAPVLPDASNNFQMVRPSEQMPGYPWQVFWGVERFNVTAKIDGRNGDMLRGVMQDNVLKLKTTFCKAREWQSPDCLPSDFDVTMKRNLAVKRD